MSEFKSPRFAFTATDFKRLEDEIMKSALGFGCPGGDIYGIHTSAVDMPVSSLKHRERALRPAVEKYFLQTNHQVAWDDIVGNDEARSALVEAIEHPVKHAALYAHYGRQVPKGVLLYGPPGCGKTMFGKAAAAVLAKLHRTSEGGCVMLHIKGPEIQSPYLGRTEETIRAIFAYSRVYRELHGRPLVIFIDEADAILPSRDGAGGRRLHAYEESQVATFLAEMDGLDGSGAFVILATNRPDAIDAAILRDGRCDRKIRVGRPCRSATERILAGALQGVPVSELETRAELAARSADVIFGEESTVARLATEIGPRALLLGDLVNGAMLVSLVEQAKALAFRRDLDTGGAPSGVRFDDLAGAIVSVARQNAGLVHAAAMAEVGEREGFRMAQVIRGDGPAPRYGLGSDGDVVQLQ